MEPGNRFIIIAVITVILSTVLYSWTAHVALTAHFRRSHSKSYIRKLRKASTIFEHITARYWLRVSCTRVERTVVLFIGYNLISIIIITILGIFVESNALPFHLFEAVFYIFIAKDAIIYLISFITVKKFLRYHR